MRPHSREELARKLRRRGCGAEAIALALDRATELGYLDEAAYARALVRLRSRGRGELAIGAELVSRGVSRELTAEVLAELEPEVQVAAAARLLKKMLVPGAEPTHVLGRLQRRGFPPSVTRQAWREVVAEGGTVLDVVNRRLHTLDRPH